MVGVGANAFRVYLSTVHDFLNFLRSNDSLRMYNNSQLDIVNLANMFGIRIATFTYNINDQPPRWTWHSPHQYITSYSQHRNVEGPDMWLFHEDDCHYDLLVPREVVQLHCATVPEVPTVLSQQIVQQVPAMPPQPSRARSHPLKKTNPCSTRVAGAIPCSLDAHASIVSRPTHFSCLDSRVRTLFRRSLRPLRFTYGAQRPSWTTSSSPKVGALPLPRQRAALRHSPRACPASGAL